MKSTLFYSVWSSRRAAFPPRRGRRFFGDPRMDTRVEDRVVTFGLRTVDQRGGFFRLNGRPTGIFGVQIMGYRVPLIYIKASCPPLRG